MYTDCQLLAGGGVGEDLVTAKVQVDNVYKIFGPSPDKALILAEQGATREDILNETGNVVAVAKASFEVKQGEIFMVMGLSGSGKSTLIRCVNRLISPTAGRVFVDEEEITIADGQQLREIRRNKMGMVFQHFALFPHKTVAENVQYGLKVQGVASQERNEKALEALEVVGLGGWGDYYPHNLSGGMQQRVGLARALAKDPEILLMDEAFSALDPLIRREMQDELMELQRTVHKTIIFITHDLSEALKLGDQVAVMKDGRIVQIGSPQNIVSEPTDDYVAAFTQDVDRGRVFTVGSIIREIEPLLEREDTVETALSRMRENNLDALHVVDEDSKPVGIVTRQAVGVATREGVRDLGRVINTEYPATGASETLADVYDLTAAGLPIAVLDEEGTLIGVVDATDMIGNLTPDTDTEPLKVVM